MLRVLASRGGLRIHLARPHTGGQKYQTCMCGTTWAPLVGWIAKGPVGHAVCAEKPRVPMPCPYPTQSRNLFLLHPRLIFSKPRGRLQPGRGNAWAVVLEGKTLRIPSFVLNLSDFQVHAIQAPTGPTIANVIASYSQTCIFALSRPRPREPRLPCRPRHPPSACAWSSRRSWSHQ